MTTKTLDISEVRDHLDEVFSSVASGTEILIEKDKKLFARVTPVSVSAKKRTPGLGRGEVWISPDFDDPLPDSFWLGNE